jgi:hypothetical protein
MDGVVSGSTAAARTDRPLSGLDRQRISYLRLVLVLALVFLHYGGLYGSDLSPFRGYTGQDLPVASILISFILYLGFTAVPAMSALSGFLFFKGATRNLPPRFVDKWRRRAVSLVLPFLLWSSGFAALAYGVHLIWPEMFASDFAARGRSLARILADEVLGMTRPPVAFQLWFVRDLIVTIAVSPVIWVLVGRLPRLTLAALTVLWIADEHLWIFQRLDVPLFFAFGAACAMQGFRPDLPRRWIVPVFLLFMAVVMARTVSPFFLGFSAGWIFDIGTAAMRVLGALAVWNISALLLTGGFAAWVQRNSHLAFFIHCAHFPTILFVKIGLARVIDTGSEAGQIALYFVTVGVVIVLLLAVARVTSAWTPATFRVLSGGRTGDGRGLRRSGFLTA